MLFIIFALVGAQAASAPADVADAKCMFAVASVVDRGQSDLASEQTGRTAVFFFGGKIVGRSGRAAVAPAGEAAMKEMEVFSPDQFRSLAAKCHAEVASAFAK